MSTAEAWTIGRLLTWTADYLKKHGSTSPRLDAEVLLAEARGCGRIELYTAFSEEPSEEVRASFKEMVRRRAEGSPVAYLVGRKEFYSLAFEVNPDVLIPRPETEHLVVEAIDRAKQLTGQAPGSQTASYQNTSSQAPSEVPNNKTPVPRVDEAGKGAEQGGAGQDEPAQDVAVQGEEAEWTPRPKTLKSYNGLRIADVGTGSGSIAISLAKALPGCSIVALDCSPAALAVAKRNVDKHAVGNQVTVLESDLLSAVTEKSFDIVVSNPPYISEAEYAALPISVRSYEPKSALVGGPLGTELIERLLQQTAPRLRSGGWLIIEFSPMIADRVASLVDRAMWSEPVITKDLAGLARIMALARR